MPFITIGSSSQLQLVVPTRGSTGWDERMRTDTFLKIAQHDHSGSSGNGVQLSTGALAADSVTGAKIRLDNDEYLRGRNQADSADKNIIKVDTNDEVVFGTTVATIDIQDDGLTIVDNADNTKVLAFDVSGVTTGTTRTLTIPDASTTIVGTDATQTLTNKTINGATLGTATINSPTVLDVSDAVFSIQDNADATKEIRFQASGITTGTIRTATMPDADITLVGTAATQTLTNKTIDSDNNTITNIVNADIKAAAAIAVNKLAATTASRALASDGSGFITAATTTATELDYVSGVTSAIQTQIDGKLPTTITTTGDIIYSSSGSTAARLGIGSAGQVLTVSGGVPAWATNTVSPVATTSKTTTYTATTSDETILADTSGGAWTLTLYAASGNSGRKLTVKKTTSDSNLLTIDGNASETIDGDTTITLALQYESVELVCDGSNWHIADEVRPEVYARARKTASTSIANNTATDVDFGANFTADADSHSAFDTSNDYYVVPVTGFYVVGMNGMWDGNGTGFRKIEILAGSTALAQHNFSSPSASFDSSVTCTGAAYLTKGDQVKWKVTQNSGGALNLQGSTDARTVLWIKKI